MQRRAVHRVLPRRRAHSRGILQQTGRAIHRGGDARLAVLGVETPERAPRLARVDLIVKPLRVLKQRGVPQCAASYGTFPNVSNALADATQSVALYTRASSARGYASR